MRKHTVIKCECGHTLGEYLGEIKNQGEKFHLHKCLKCRKQMRTPQKDGLDFA